MDKYTAIARVLRSHFQYPEGEDPGEWERWEYEYFKSGQCIDVEIVKGDVHLDRVSHEGEQIKGIWGCDKSDLGFVQILGSPEVGDLVGFATYRMSFGARILLWNRIEKGISIDPTPAQAEESSE